MTVFKGTIRWYRQSYKDSKSVSGRFSVGDKLTSEIEFPEKEDLIAEYDSDKKELIIRIM
jgi:hypothetical protein